MSKVNRRQSAETKLRVWGVHWRARLEGYPLENLSVEPLRVIEEGDTEKEINALKLLHPRLTPEEAREAIKYGPTRRHMPVSYGLPDMADLENAVFLASRRAADALWERFTSEELGCEPEALLWTSWKGKVTAVQAVKYLVREVYVVGRGLRGSWRPTEFDFIYPYAIEQRARKSNGREATLGLVKASL